MKILNLQKNTTLAFLLFVLILINNYVESFSSSDIDLDLVSNLKSSGRESEKLNGKKTQKKTHLKNNKKTKLDSEKVKETEKEKENSEVSDEELQLKFIEKMEENKQKNDSYIYASWFIFVPLVLLIFIMTILSIIGFLILILNSPSDGNAELDKKEILRAQINQLSGRNVTNQEILDILKNKKHKKNKKKKQTSYKPEPEPETVLLGN